MGVPYRILAFDGGGVCGAYSTAILLRLLQSHPDLLDRTDLLAGTSTGGIIALCLAHGMSPEAVLGLYVNRSSEIFHAHCSLGGLLGPTYEGDGLARVCRDALGDARLGDLSKRVLVPAFDLMSDGTPDDPSWRVKFFHNFDTDPRRDPINPYKAELASDVAIRTASAPTYFAPYQGFCDGGVAANNPACIAVAQAVSAGNALGDVHLLSIGTGGQIRYVDGNAMHWGELAWVRPLINVFMDSQLLVADHAASSLLGDRYHRVDPVIPDVQMDDVNAIPRLIDEANAANLTDCRQFLTDRFLA